MKSRNWFVAVVLMSCFLAFRPPVAAVTAEEENERVEHLEREVEELKELMERAMDAGREEEALDLRRELGRLLDEMEELEHDEDEDEREHHQDELEMHMRELEARRQTIEAEMAEMELKLRGVELLSNPLAMSLDAIDMASHHLESEEAAEFFAELLEESKHFSVKQRLRQRLVDLNFELGRREVAKQHLRRLIVPSDD